MAKSTTQSGFTRLEKVMVSVLVASVVAGVAMVAIGAIESGDFATQLVAGFGIAVFAYAGYVGFQPTPAKVEVQDR